MLTTIAGTGVSDGQPPAVHNESLKDRTKRWRKLLLEVNAGPYLVASEVHQLVDNWPAYKSEADGKTASGWLKSVFGGGKGTSYWETRHKAQLLLGESIRRTIPHDVAVWLTRLHLTQGEREKSRDLLMLACRQHANGVPLDMAEARLLLEPTIGHAFRSVICKGCVELQGRLEKVEAELAAMRGEVTE